MRPRPQSKPEDRDARLMEMRLACAAVTNPGLQRALLKLARAIAEDQEQTA
jgi:hypothetical protein